MSVDIELQNSLNNLSGRVIELTKQVKTLDTGLSGALSQGSRHAKNLAESVRGAHHELSLVDQVSEHIGHSWSRQLMHMTIGAVGVHSLWEGIASAVDRAEARTQEGAKATASFAGNTRQIGDNPALRAAIRSSATLLNPDEQASALKSFRKEGGKVGDVDRLGKFLNEGVTLGLDSTATSGTFAMLRRLGVDNPEDVIARANQEGKDLDALKTKPGALRAYARQKASTGAFDRARAATKTDKTDKLQILQRGVQASTASERANQPEALEEVTANELIDAIRENVPGSVERALKLLDLDPSLLNGTGDNRNEADRTILQRLNKASSWNKRGILPGEIRRNAPVRAAQSQMRVIIDGDSRPTPINVGD